MPIERPPPEFWVFWVFLGRPESGLKDFWVFLGRQFWDRGKREEGGRPCRERAEAVEFERDLAGISKEFGKVLGVV